MKVNISLTYDLGKEYDNCSKAEIAQIVFEEIVNAIPLYHLDHLALLSTQSDLANVYKIAYEYHKKWNHITKSQQWYLTTDAHDNFEQSKEQKDILEDLRTRIAASFGVTLVNDEQGEFGKPKESYLTMRWTPKEGGLKQVSTIVRSVEHVK